MQGGDGLLQQQDRLHQGGDRQVESLLIAGDQVCQGLGPGQGRTPEQGPNEIADRDPHSAEGLRAGPPAIYIDAVAGAWRHGWGAAGRYLTS